MRSRVTWDKIAKVINCFDHELTREINFETSEWVNEKKGSRATFKTPRVIVNLINLICFQLNFALNECLLLFNGKVSHWKHGRSLSIWIPIICCQLKLSCELGGACIKENYELFIVFYAIKKYKLKYYFPINYRHFQCL